MRRKTIAALPLAPLTHDYGSLAEKIGDCARQFRLAADAGADLVVFPEALNHYQGNYPNAKVHTHFRDAALDDWRSDFSPLIDAVREKRVAAAVPVVVRDGGCVANRFYLVGRDGSDLGHYQKSVPTPIELEQGVRPGDSPLIEWEGLKVGGAICFDLYYPRVFERQARAGADLFLVPSFTAGGMHVNFHALNHSAPIVLAYPQWSRIVDVDGRELAAGGFRNETLTFGYGPARVMATLNFNRVALYADKNQERINDALARHGSRLHVTFDQPNALFVLESRDDSLPIEQVVREFSLIPRRDYFAHSLALSEAQQDPRQEPRTK